MASVHANVVWFVAAALVYLLSDAAVVGKVCKFDVRGGGKHRGRGNDTMDTSNYPFIALLTAVDQPDKVFAHGVLYQARNRLFVLTTRHSLEAPGSAESLPAGKSVKPGATAADSKTTRWRIPAMIEIHIGRRTLSPLLRKGMIVMGKKLAVKKAGSADDTENDLAIIQINETVEFNTYMKPVVLPKTAESQTLIPGTKFMVSKFDQRKKMVIQGEATVQSGAGIINAKFADQQLTVDPADAGVAAALNCDNQWTLYGMVVGGSGTNLILQDMMPHISWIERAINAFSWLGESAIIEIS